MHNEQQKITQQIVQQSNKIQVVSGGMVFTRFLWQNKLNFQSTIFVQRKVILIKVSKIT